MTDLDPESIRILELARSARTPSKEDKARVARRLPLALGLSATAASGVTAAHAAKGATAAKSTTLLATFKWWIGGSAMLASALASYVTLSSPTVTPHPISSPQPAPAPAVKAAELRVQPEAAPAPQPTAQPNAEPRPERVLRRGELPRRSTDRESLGAELDLLHRAQSAWRARQASAALTLLTEHRLRYPHSQLQLERDALQVLTLCELGRKDDAVRLAHNVIERAPRSPVRASLEQSCALK
jgi:hypothetical protein